MASLPMASPTNNTPSRRLTSGNPRTPTRSTRSSVKTTGSTGRHGSARSRRMPTGAASTTPVSQRPPSRALVFDPTTTVTAAATRVGASTTATATTLERARPQPLQLPSPAAVLPPLSLPLSSNSGNGGSLAAVAAAGTLVETTPTRSDLTALLTAVTPSSPEVAVYNLGVYLAAGPTPCNQLMPSRADIAALLRLRGIGLRARYALAGLHHGWPPSPDNRPALEALRDAHAPWMATVAPVPPPLLINDTVSDETVWRRQSELCDSKLAQELQQEENERWPAWGSPAAYSSSGSSYGGMWGSSVDTDGRNLDIQPPKTPLLHGDADLALQALADHLAADAPPPDSPGFSSSSGSYSSVGGFSTVGCYSSNSGSKRPVGGPEIKAMLLPLTRHEIETLLRMPGSSRAHAALEGMMDGEAPSPGAREALVAMRDAYALRASTTELAPGTAAVLMRSRGGEDEQGAGCSWQDHGWRQEVGGEQEVEKEEEEEEDKQEGERRPLQRAMQWLRAKLVRRR